MSEKNVNFTFAIPGTSYRVYVSARVLVDPPGPRTMAEPMGSDPGTVEVEILSVKDYGDVEMPYELWEKWEGQMDEKALEKFDNKY